MAAVLSEPGAVFGRWSVVRSFAPPAGGPSLATVACACGTVRDVLMNSLRTGRSRSCGCYMRERSREQIRRIGTKHGLSKDAAYPTWKAIKARCLNSRNHKFPEYGGRGIGICDAWRDDFVAFREHIGPRPSATHSVDRIDNARGYEPGNVRWATPKEQSNNRRRRRWGRKPKEAK